MISSNLRSNRLVSLAGWVAWVLGLLTIGASAYLSTLNPAISTEEAREPLAQGLIWVSTWVGFGLVGALILKNRPRNRIGWILCGITFGLGLTLFASAYARYSLVTRSGQLPLGNVAAWLATWMFSGLVLLVIALVVLFPSGSATTDVSRWTLRFAGAFAFMSAVSFALRPGPVEGDTPPDNPLGLSGTKPFFDSAIEVLSVGLGAIAVLALVDAIIRFRRARGVERQQFRWFVFAMASFPLLFFTSLAIEEAVIGYDGFDPVVVAFALWGNGTAIAIGLAVTRHGLFEIDRIISRTLSFGLLTAALAGVYLALVFVMRELLPFQGQLPVAASTLAIAALFGPLRRRVQSWVDRRFNRSRYDANRTIETFSARILTDVDLDELSSGLRTTAVEIMQPASAAIWLR